MPDQEYFHPPMPTAIPPSTPASTNRVIYHVQFFRRARPAEIKEKLWTEFWYAPCIQVRHLPTEEAARAEAEARCVAGAWREGWMIRDGEEPDADGWLKPGWHVYRLDLIKAADLSKVAEGSLAAWVPQNEEPTFRGEQLALSQARATWRKGDARSAIRVMAEAVTLRELVQRRADSHRATGG